MQFHTNLSRRGREWVKCIEKKLSLLHSRINLCVRGQDGPCDACTTVSLAYAGASKRNNNIYIISLARAYVCASKAVANAPHGPSWPRTLEFVLDRAEATSSRYIWKVSCCRTTKNQSTYSMKYCK